MAGRQLVVSVGVDSSSEPKGALRVLAACREALAGTNAIVREVSGNGAMWMEPTVEIKRPGEPPIVYGWIAPEDVPALLAGDLQERAVGVRGSEAFGGIPPLDEHPFFKHQLRIVIEDFGVIDPDSIEDAIARGAYSVSQGALRDDAGRGDRRGDGLRAARPRRRRIPGRHQVGKRPQGASHARSSSSVNSHEGEPNVYKDRRIHEGDPHRILEGMLIASVVCGAERAYNYIGGEYPLAIKRFRKAVADAERLGLIGKNMLGSGQDVEVRVRTGGGAYICGEGSALMYSVMGVRGQPRTKPPRSVEEGLWKRPTVLNNTETLRQRPRHHQQGRRVVRQIGTEKSAGTKMMTVQGPLKHVGLVEVPMGITLRTLIEEVWGGMRDGHQFKGMQTGGVSAGPLTAEHLDYAGRFRLDDRGRRHARLRRLRRLRPARLCRRLRPLPDRVQSRRVVLQVRSLPPRQPGAGRNLDRIRLGGGSREDLPLMERTSKHIIELSLCGLGQVAPMPLLGMMKMYPQDFLDHIERHVCAAGVCPIAAPETLAAAAD